MKKSFPTTISLLILLTAVFIPLAASAQSNAVVSFVSLVQSIINALFPILIGIAILMFGYNVTKFMLASTDVSRTGAQQLDTYKKGIMQSILALFVIFTIMGLVSVLANSFGLGALGQNIGTSTAAGTANGTAAGISTFRNIALSIARFGSQRIIPILTAGALLFFIGNVVISMAKTEDVNEREKLNKFMLWGILALFITFTLFGIVGTFTGSLFGTGAVIPQFPTSQ